MQENISNQDFSFREGVKIVGARYNGLMAERFNTPYMKRAIGFEVSRVRDRAYESIVNATAEEMVKSKSDEDRKATLQFAMNATIPITRLDYPNAQLKFFNSVLTRVSVIESGFSQTPQR